MSFKKGDRVRVYTGKEVFTGTVDSIGLVNDIIFIIEDGFYSCRLDSPFHRKQCRRLVKKERRRIWINIYPGLKLHDSDAHLYDSLESAERNKMNPTAKSVEFVEVRRKKCGT